jgi:hypothetical protein
VSAGTFPLDHRCRKCAAVMLRALRPDLISTAVPALGTAGEGAHGPNCLLAAGLMPSGKAGATSKGSEVMLRRAARAQLSASTGAPGVRVGFASGNGRSTTSISFAST